jgi:hypothetical protein
MGVSGQLHASAALPLAPIGERLSGSLSRSRRYGEVKVKKKGDVVPVLN